MKTRQNEDLYTSIKVPDSIRKHLKLIAAKENRFIYQVLADMVLLYIESKETSSIRKHS
jgi:hypothetical protein